MAEENCFSQPTLICEALNREITPLHTNPHDANDAYEEARRHTRHILQLLGLLPSNRATECPLKNRIHDFRKQNRWTLKKLATVSGIPYNTLWRMERGRGTKLDSAYKVATAFHVSVYELYSTLSTGTSSVAKGAHLHSVRELRLKLNWGLRDLAEASGVSSTTLCYVEKGYIPKVDKALKIAAALGVSVYQIWKP